MHFKQQLDFQFKVGLWEGTIKNSNGIDLNKKLSLSKNNNEINCITCFKLSHSTLRRSGQMNGEVY